MWAKLLPLDDVAFIILTRDDEQAWISSNLRRHIQSRRFTHAYDQGITSSLRHFLNRYEREFRSFEFEDLLLRPESTIEDLNGFLGISLDMDDLRATYRYPLYKKSKGTKDKLKATAIYLKNYGVRYR